MDNRIAEYWFPNSDKEIDQLKQGSQMKLNVRNILGIRHQDDWIFNLNIGNVMHLATMSVEELETKLDTTHELNRDAMLEKIVLLTVACFCVATELRFIAMKEEHENDPSLPAIAPPLLESTMPAKKLNSRIKFKRKCSELWHTKSVRTGCTFLAPECPLVNHILNNYRKHH
jgi:hypothetical protein